MTDKTKRFLLDTLERAARTALQAYLAVWVAGTPDYDHLFTRSNFEGAVVGLALSIAMSVGAKKAGADDSASLLPANVDPPQPVRKRAPAKKPAKKRA